MHKKDFQLSLFVQIQNCPIQSPEESGYNMIDLKILEQIILGCTSLFMEI